MDQPDLKMGDPATVLSASNPTLASRRPVLAELSGPEWDSIKIVK